jgi:hypothetical protein
MYGPMSKLKNKQLTKLLGPLFKAKWSKTTRKKFFLNVLGHFGVSKGPQVGKMYGLMSKF